ncbi:hypothetical protein PS862_00281 [Pseudomonas fluorescens]|uniref:Uncharacterized protein n=1 Tax=Pseudomonas fluorescens TaxID=294 RepID=A0A5E7GHU5_PSEFL|nr:hypothetical protein [Pseudomonas fluorescens]VVO50382.1 hypothetical protein PS862_00281 [Pseudomonas fluorescens]
MTESDQQAAEVERLSMKIERMKLEQKRKEVDAAAKPPQKAWWTSAIEFLALPAAVIAIVSQLTGTIGSVHDQEKTQAETQKIRTEEVKTRAELEGLLDDLAQKKQAGVESYRAEIEKTLPQLQDTLTRLRSIKADSDRAILERALPKYILLWVLFHAVGLIFDVIAQAWSALLTSASMAVFNRRRPSDSNAKKIARWDQVMRTTQWIIAFAGMIPNILRWSIQLSIFLALMVPLFNETAHLLGSDTTFDSIVELAKHLDLSGIIEKMREIMFDVHR